METHRPQRTRPLVETRHIAVPVAINRALTAMAERAGHGNASRIVQELLVREAIFQFGPDWAQRFADSEENVA